MNTKLKIKDKKLKMLKNPFYPLLTTHYPLKKGQVMIIALVFLAVVLIIASSLFSRVADFIRFGSNSVQNEQAIELADAGIDYATQRLNDTAGAYPNVSGEGTDTQTLPTGQVVIQVTSGGTNLKKITATGYIPNQSSPRAKRTVKADIVVSGESISFRYAVQTDEGGVTMSQSATIKGSIYSNASISAGNGNQQAIEGDAFAVGTIESPPIDIGGLKRENQPSKDPPTVNYDFWKNQANKNNDPITCNPKCTISNSTTIGPKKYIGDLEITNNAYVTLNGPVYVTGNFSMSQGETTLKLADAFGSNNTVLIIDGLASLTQGGKFEPTTANPKGYIMLVTTSTSDQALTLSQSGATAIFYALEGGAELSQSANVTSLVAYKLTMTQSSTLSYDTGLADAQFTTGPGGSWQVKKGTYKFTSSP